ncbi:DUF928 domain-containing protein [Mucilaginibacter sp. CAU 1740]|uniref:DUF928 domain-containing protein n=1 Tax=Mucilaginibacter sp. CAU 1740 TaxID=3140365 RepID=UPI00325B837F
MIKKIMFFLLLGCCAPAFAQINVQFVPETNGRNLNGLLNCRIINQVQPARVTLTITVTERQSGTVCKIVTPGFSLPTGSNPIPLAAARGAMIQFSDNRLGQLTSRSRIFQEGDYEYCYEISFEHSDNAPLEQCFSYTLAPFSELNLIDPYDEDVICDKRPVLTWQPLVPAIPGARYRLTLTEIKKGQSATEALNYNLPLIDQANLISPVLTYPPIAKELQNKKKYAWQVTAYMDQTILNRSEIWQFKVDCADTAKTVRDDHIYRDIEDLAGGNYYVARGYVKFALVNSYQEQKLIYRVYALEDQDKKIRGLPAVKIQNGRNQVIIDLTGNSAFKKGQFYIMEIRMPGGGLKNLRFSYDEVADTD